jgi:hypothetical protein
MRRLAVILTVAAVCEFALAAGPHQEAGTESVNEPSGLIPNAGGDFDLLGNWDTDHFSAWHARVGLLWSLESINQFSGIHVGVDEYRQGNWSRHGSSLLGAYKDTDRATGAGLTIVGGASSASNATRAVGEFTWNVRLSPATGVEFVGNRAFVETRAGIDQATMSNFLAASADHSINDRLTLIGLVGAQQFSDDNSRLHLRGRAIYLLSPEYGVSVEARARAYESSRSGPANYFNPEHYARGELGLRLRRSFGDWRVFAEAGAGGETVEHLSHKATYYGGLRAQRTFANDLTFSVNYSTQRSSESDGATSVESKYRWQYLRAFFIVPF